MIPTTANDVSRSRNHSMTMMKDESTMKQNESLQSIKQHNHVERSSTVWAAMGTAWTINLQALGIQKAESTGITVAEGHSSGKRVCVHIKLSQRSQRRDFTGNRTRELITVQIQLRQGSQGNPNLRGD